MLNEQALKLGDKLIEEKITGGLLSIKYSDSIKQKDNKFAFELKVVVSYNAKDDFRQVRIAQGAVFTNLLVFFVETGGFRMVSSEKLF